MTIYLTMGRGVISLLCNSFRARTRYVVYGLYVMHNMQFRKQRIETALVNHGAN